MLDLFYNGGNPITYWLLRSILLVSLLWSGYCISYKDPKGKYFWRYASVSIILYSLIQGLRYMRGADYSGYMAGFINGYGEKDEVEPLWQVFLYVFHLFNFHYSIGFVICSALLIYSFARVLKHFPNAAFWAFPLFLLLTGSSENIVRQYVAASFFLLAFDSFLSKKVFKMYIELIICYLIHFSAIWIALIFLILIKKKSIKSKSIYTPLVLYFIYVFVFFFWDVSLFKYVVEFVELMNPQTIRGGTMYIENASDFFTEAGSINLILGTNGGHNSWIFNTIEFISSSIVIIVGYTEVRNDIKLFVVYVFAYLAILFHTLGADIQVYARFYNWFVVLSSIIYGVITFGHCEDNKNGTLSKPILIAFYSVFFFLQFYCYGFLMRIGSVGYAGCAFIWDQ